MKKIIFAMMFCVSSAVFAQPKSGERYFIKAYNEQYVGIKGDVLVLVDEGQRTPFVIQKLRGEGFSISTYEAGYIFMEGEDRFRLTAFSFQELKPNIYNIKSLKSNTYLRANTDIGQIDKAEHAKRWEAFELVVVSEKDANDWFDSKKRDADRQLAEFLDSYEEQRKIQARILATPGLVLTPKNLSDLADWDASLLKAQIYVYKAAWNSFERRPASNHVRGFLRHNGLSTCFILMKDGNVQMSVLNI